MAEIQEYKCPNCGGSIEWDSKAQKLKCPYCDTEFEPDALKADDDDSRAEAPDEMSWDTDAGSSWTDDELGGFRTYICKSCGGEIVAEATTAAMSCPFCGNAVTMTENLSGTLRPDCVIPFKITKKQAKEALLEHYKGKKLLPPVFRDANHIDEIRGIYVPFWLFDGDAKADIRYKATTVRSWSDRDYNYTETSYYNLYRAGDLSFMRVPVDGSSKMPDDLMESIEPFDMSESVDFKSAYLAGFLADKYDVDAETSVERANARIKKSTEDVFASTVSGYATVTADSSSVRVGGGKVSYALLPVWLLNTTWEGKQYTFAMNGQTGKFVGNLPTDGKLAFKWWAIYAGIAAAVTFFLSAVVYPIFMSM